MKYLFTVGFKDGTYYTQTPDDISKIDPIRSCYYDVLQQEEAGNPPIALCIEAADGSGKDYLVSLIDGHFEVNGVPFWLHEPVSAENLKLIYYRKIVRTYQGSEEIGCDTAFVIGWQIRGTNIEKTITVK